jgi:hypothetical protein
VQGPNDALTGYVGGGNGDSFFHGNTEFPTELGVSNFNMQNTMGGGNYG